MSVQPRHPEWLNNTPLLRWLVGVATGLAVLHLVLLLLWGPGQIPGVLPWYAVVVDSFSILAALAIAFVAFGRYQVLRDPPAFWIGVAFTGFALFSTFDILTAPGLIPGQVAILAHLGGTSSWFWHLMFSALALFLLAAGIVRWPRSGTFDRRSWLWAPIAWAIVCAIVSILIIAKEQILPALLVNGTFTALNVAWGYALLIAFATGTVLSAFRYRQTGNSLFGFVALTQLVLAFAMWTDIIGTALYDVWWYWRRILWVGAFSVILFGLLAEYVTLFRRELARAHELEGLQRVTGALVHEMELPRVADVIVHLGRDVVGIDAVAVWLVDPPHRELALVAANGLSPFFVEAIRHLPLAPSTLAPVAALEDRLVVVEDVASSELPWLNRELYLREGLRSLIAAPLRARGRLVGIVGYASRTPRRFSETDRRFIMTVGDLFAVAIENARLYDEVRRALQLREEFMSAAAHELRSPIAVIKGRAQLTLKVDAREEDARRALEDILRASERITRLTDDLLAVIRVRPNLIQLDRERIDLSSLTRDVVDQVARSVVGHEFRVKIDGPLIVDADRGLIREVLNRLLENAIRYAPEGGVIDVETCQQDGNAVVSVTDHGVVIPIERQAQVFEPFYESIRPGTPGYVGLVSLGLYLSKQIVDAHGGRIWFVSDPQKGSTFSFSLALDLRSATTGLVST